MTREDLEKRIAEITETIEMVDGVLRAKLTDDMASYSIKTELREQKVEAYSIKDLRDLKKDYLAERRVFQKKLDRLGGNKGPRIVVPRFRD